MSNDQTLEWRNGLPHSAIFGDIYFSRESGIAETHHVFLQHNRLEQRWRQWTLPLFTIAETGFGTGLNFLCAWQLWGQCAPPGARLHFVSTEKYPLPPADLAKALALWPELAEFRAQLMAQYRWLAPGWRRMEFDGGRVTLTLLIGDARETLPRLEASADAWFLDGFAPARNPDMWQREILAEIARLSAPGCTFATFTSAGAVRRGLEEAGFAVEKVAGFGTKRDMLCGEYTGAAHRAPDLTPTRAIVIGGGIAGAASACSLARRGWQVTLIERHAGLAQEASGNPQGVLYPRLSGHDIPLSRIALQGFLHTLSLLQSLPGKGRDWDDCGLLQLAFDARERKRCEEVVQRNLPADVVAAVDAGQAALLAGVELPHGGLWFPSGGWVNPPALCRMLAQQPGIILRTASHALALERGEHGWQVRDASGCLAEAPLVILSGAHDLVQFAQAAHLPLAPVRGQITLLPATTDSARLKSVVCTEGYISPARNGLHCAGATFAPDDRSLEPRAADHAQNLAMLKHLSPALYHGLNGTALEAGQLHGRAALRCVTPDYLPMAGPLLDAGLMAERYSIGSRAPAAHLPWLEGLFINAGHGSKGLLTAPLCAEILAAMLAGEPLPLDTPLVRALDPNRFLLRQRGLRRLIGAAIG